MKSFFYMTLFLLCQFSFGQDSSQVVWTKHFALPIDKNATWTSDNYNNLYLSHKDLISKFNPEGKKLFEQSLKRYGEIKTIDARNPMKILIFSEEQQSLFYVDNTLTKQENDLDLSAYDLSYVTQVSGSGQQDKIWTYDQDNSKIKLISQKKAQSIQLENTAGIIEMNHISQFFEQDNRLFVVDSLKGIFVFDIYGTLIQFIEEKKIQWLCVNKEYLYILKSNQEFEIVNSFNLSKKKLNLPVDKVLEFSVNQSVVFLKTGGEILKYTVNFTSQ